MRYATMITLVMLGFIMITDNLTFADSTVQRSTNVLLALQDNNTVEYVADAPERVKSAGRSNIKEETPMTPKSERSMVRTDQESISKGKNLFEKLCKVCHDAYSDTITVIGPGLKGLLKNDLLPVSKKPATAENILIQFDKPLNKMPSFHWISEEDKLNIIAFLNTL